MKQSTVLKILGGVTVAAIGGAFAYRQATRPPVINAKVPEPAKPVDLPRYLGKWYELARHENRFEKGLDAVTAEYAAAPGGKIRITNGGCQGGPGGERSFVEGKVSFFGPFYTGDYWVLDHGESYDWAIVGEPSGRYLWVLAREPRPAAVEAIMKRVEALGYDRWALRPTRHI